MNIFCDYSWKNGIPVGVGPVAKKQAHYYKVLTEPYHRYYVVEEYRDESFVGIAYDSQLFDFRWLTPASQVGWRKTKEQDNTFLIRNLEERIVLKEQYHYKADLCISCRSFSPHGPLVSEQKIFYQQLGDPFNRVILFDSQERPVMVKSYTVDANGDFDQLEWEEWDMTNQGT